MQERSDPRFRNVVLFLHGLESGPDGPKGTFLRENLSDSHTVLTPNLEVFFFLNDLTSHISCTICQSVYVECRNVFVSSRSSRQIRI